MAFGAVYRFYGDRFHGHLGFILVILFRFGIRFDGFCEIRRWSQSLDLVSLVDFVGEFGVWILALPSIVICDSVMGLYLLDIRPRVKPEGETDMLKPEGETLILILTFNWI